MTSRNSLAIGTGELGPGGNRPNPQAKLRLNLGEEPREKVLANRVGRCGLVLFDVRSRRHGNNDVLSLFVIRLNHAKGEFVLVDPKARRFAGGQKRGMLIVLWPNAVCNAVRLESVFLAEDLLCVLVLAVG